LAGLVPGPVDFVDRIPSISNSLDNLGVAGDLLRSLPEQARGRCLQAAADDALLRICQEPVAVAHLREQLCGMVDI
jgi:hypothetical protein